MIKRLSKLVHSRQQTINPNSQGGFTLIELLVVIVIIGILGAIAVPSWLGFLNQRRVNLTNDFIYQSLKKAQTTAKTDKIEYSVSFRMSDENIPEVAVHPATLDPGNLQNPQEEDAMERYWTVGNLGEQLELQSGQVILQTNLEAETANTEVDPSSLSTIENGPNNTYTITFDNLGVLAGQDPDAGLIVAAAAPKNNDATEPQESTIRCVSVQTILGALKTGFGQGECSP